MGQASFRPWRVSSPPTHFRLGSGRHHKEANQGAPLICEPSLKLMRLVDRRLILLEINFPITIHLSHCGDHDISQYVEILGPVQATISPMEQSDSARRDPSPNRYGNATRACRLFHVFCIVTGPLRSIHSYRSIVCWRKHGFVGENYISPVTIHIILSKREPIEPMFLREFLLHSCASWSKSSLRHAVSYSFRATGESSVEF
jgi:hypothetical protein